MKQEKQQQQLTWIVRPPFPPFIHILLIHGQREIATAADFMRSVYPQQSHIPKSMLHSLAEVEVKGIRYSTAAATPPHGLERNTCDVF